MWDKRGGCFSQKSQLESRVPVCLEIARGGMDKAQADSGSLVWASHSSTVSLSLLNYKYSSTQKRTPGNQNLASPCDFSKEGLHTESFTLSFSLIIRVGVRWGWMQLLMKLEGQCLQIKH